MSPKGVLGQARRVFPVLKTACGIFRKEHNINVLSLASVCVVRTECEDLYRPRN